MTDDNPENVAACFDPAQGCYMVTFDTYQEARAESHRLTAELELARAEIQECRKSKLVVLDSYWKRRAEDAEAALETARAADAASESRSWPEDFQHENGMYTCTCASCGGGFIGYKRRVTCRVCANKKGDA